MKLYYSPGACSLASHIVLEEIGVPYEIEKVALKEQTTETGKDYLTITSKGAVPVLELDNREILSEGVAILQYLGDLKPDKKLVPSTGGFARVRLQEWLNYLATDIHKGFGNIFAAERLVTAPEARAELKANAQKNLAKKFDYLSTHLKTNTFLMGADYSVADAYLFTTLRWATRVGPEVPADLQAYMNRVRARTAVQKVLKIEGLA